MDIAQLGIAVETAGLQQGELSLKKLSGAAKVAENAAKGVTNGLHGAAAAIARTVTGTNSHAAAVAASTTKIDANTTAVRANSAALAIQAKNSRMAAFQQRNLLFQLVDVGQAIPLAFQSPIFFLQQIAMQGAQIAQIYAGPGQGGVKQALQETAAMLGRGARGILGFVATALTRFPLVTAAIGGITAAFGVLRYEINRTGDAQVTMWDTARAVALTAYDGISSAIGGIVGALYQRLQPAITAISDWFSWTYHKVIAGTKLVGNTIINAFAAAFGTARTIWNALPDVLGDIFVRAGNRAIGAVEAILQKIAVKWNNWILAHPLLAERLFGKTPAEMTVKPPEFGRLDNPYQGALSRMTHDIATGVTDQFSQDPLGKVFSTISQRAQELADLRNQADAVGTSLSGAAEVGRRAWGEFTPPIIAANNNLRDARSMVGSFITDLRNGLQQGESMWRSFGSAAVNVLNRVTDMLLNQILDAIFMVNRNIGGIGRGFGSSSIVGGGSFIPGFTGFGLFANGGYTGDGPRNAAAGIVHRGEYVINADATKRYRPALEAMNQNRPLPAAADGNTVIELRLSRELEERILYKSGKQTVQIVRQSAPEIARQGADMAQERYGRMGGFESL